MNKHIKKMILTATTLSLLSGASLVSFADADANISQVKLDIMPISATIGTETTNSITKAEPVLISAIIEEGHIKSNLNNLEFYLNNEKITFDVKPQVIDGKLMVPLAAILDELGYMYQWNSQFSSVDIIKYGKFTTLYIDKNQYFKEDLSELALSAAPIIRGDRTLVPLEFFAEVLNLSINISDNLVKLNEGGFAIHSGFIEEINEGKDGNISLTLSKNKNSKEISDLIIIHTNEDSTVFNNSNIVKGEFVKVISPMFMTMSIPAQTGGIVIY